MRAVFASSAPTATLVDRMLYYDWRFTLADNDLRKVGTMCELAGVRVSYPMLHQDVVDLSMRVPADVKMRGTRAALVLQGSDGGLPAARDHRQEQARLRPALRSVAAALAALAELIDGNLEGLRGAQHQSNPQFIDRLRSLHEQEDAAYYGVLIWTFAMLEQWFRDHGIGPLTALQARRGLERAAPDKSAAGAQRTSSAILSQGSMRGICNGSPPRVAAPHAVETAALKPAARTMPT